MTQREIFGEIDFHLQQDEKPSLYFKQISKSEQFGLPPFDVLYALKATGQSPKYHPEGSVWNHTMLVVDNAAAKRSESSNARAFMWAALLHDIGKPKTTKLRNGRLTSYDHDILGARLAKAFLQNFEEDEAFIDAVFILIRWHMQVLFVLKGLPFARIAEMKKQADIGELALLALCDRLGRHGADYDQEQKNIQMFLAKLDGHK